MISESLANGHKELKAAIPRQDQLGSGETGTKDEGKKHWIRCITAASFTLFHIATNRSCVVLEELIGDAFKGHFNCEQQVRHCVIDRRITQGTRSAAGERYHERMWSAIAACTKQKHNIFEYLHASITARLAAKPAPSLLSASWLRAGTLLYRDHHRYLRS